MEIREFLLLMRRQNKKLIFIPLLAGLTYLFTTWLLPPQYEARGLVMIQGKDYAPWVNGRERIDIDKEYVKSCTSLICTDNFLREAFKSLPVNTNIENLSGSMRIDNPKGTNLISVRMLAYKPEQAAKAVNGIIDLLDTSVNQNFPSREMIILERATSPTSPNRNFIFGVLMTLFISLQWVMSIVMFVANKSWQD